MDVRSFKPAAIEDPRPYQLEILNLAKEKNVIVYLGTGTGKTLIAVLLIKHIVEKEMAMVHTQKATLGMDVQPRICFFLVTTVPLVFQQAGVIQSNVSANTGKYCGEMGVDYWDASKWAKELATHNVIVCTAKIMENLLHTGYVTMDRVNLVIFDECHNAVGNSPYNSIMKNFYFTTPPAQRPKILGLTASPINSGLEYNESKINKILRTLEGTLDAQVVTATNKEELLKYVPVASEQLCEYDPCPVAEEVLLRLEPILFLYPPVLTIVEVLLQYVGVWGLHFYFSQPKTEELSAVGFDTSIIPLIVELCKQYMSDPTGATINPAIDMSSKFQSLVFLLKKAHNETPLEHKFCGIVFVKRRLIATLVNLALLRIDELKDVIKCAALVGHGQRKGKPDLEGYEGMTFREQCEIIGRFRKHELNLLVSTSLLEEGLDIPSCRLVVRYDIPDTLIAHVQSRGRARHIQSQYIISVERGSPVTIGFIQQLRQMEESMRSLRRDPNKVDENEQNLEVIPIQYVVPTTKAVMTYPSSLEKLHQFCATLPTDQYARLLPVFTLILDSMHGFQYKVTLPTNCAVREVEGKIHRQKLVAKQSAAYLACIQLHQAGLLNDNLLPPKPVSLFKLEDALNKLGSKKSLREYTIGLPAVFSSPFLLANPPATALFLAQIYVSGTATFEETRFAIISRFKLPPIGFRVRIHGYERRAQLRDATTLQLTPEQYEAAHNFNTVLFSNLNRSSVFDKSFAQEKNLQLPYLVAPLTQEGIVDWPAVTRASSPVSTALDWLGAGKSLDDVVVSHKIEYQRKYVVNAVRTDLNAKSPLPSSKKNKSLADKMNRRFRVSFNDLTQPLLQITKIPAPRDVVVVEHDPSLKSRAKCMPYAAPSFCEVLPFSQALFLSALNLPSILHQLEICAFTHEIASTLHLPLPDDPIWVQALTCSNINQKLNYQRLEFLGDSALKYLLSKHLFLTNPTTHEGILSQMRAHLCCNRFLFEKAIEKSLFKYIASQPLNVRGWNPNKPRTAQISDKTVADCVESLIGASFNMVQETKTQEQNALYTAVMFGYPIDPSPYPEALATLLAQQKDQNHFALSRFSEEVLGYEFKNPFLLIASFTHASKISPSGDCYQRLEFLGDAIADLLVVRYLYHKYDTIDPGALTLLKMTLVSNKTFSLLAYYHGFYKHIEHNSSTLVSTLVDFGKYVQGELLEKELTLQDISTLIEDPECDPPKILSDIFEALVAAVYLDSNMDLDRVWEVLQRLILPFMETCVHPGSHMHPVSKLTQMCQQAGCRNFAFCLEGENNGCSVKIHDHVIATVYGKNKKTAKIMAAQNAVAILSASPTLLYGLCDCKNQNDDESMTNKL
eukprot:Phypoly_transcript_00610.p1 GENE.Phypoly_transcript_00610~~Phypoly_transcript_00610.p1  ORF type:complete len:1355 (+),score=197.41 Phypoly_transcript_00610:131-4195(+)